MARDWSSNYVAADLRELQANTFAVDSAGQYALLAGCKQMGIVNLEKPAEIITKYSRDSKWDVTTGQWCPDQTKGFVIACNQRAELFHWNGINIAQRAVLQAHNRAISDVDWSKLNNNILATASMDKYIHLWDMNDHRRPCLSFSAVVGATQVRWNKSLAHLLATSHEGDVRLWDSRKNSTPVQCITAHLAKIHNIDWSPIGENFLATASQDSTVKFWDVTNPQKMEDIITLPCPVWRAQYTPFGYGLITVVVTQVRRSDNSLMLWHLRDLSSPVHTFLGNSDVVVEFGWRKETSESKDFKLVTWSRDQSLKIWKVDLQLQKSCGLPESDEDLIGGINENGTTGISAQEISEEADLNKGISSQPIAVNKLNDKNGTVPVQPQNLQQEFSLVNKNIPNLTIEEMDVIKRSCIVTAESGKFIVCLKLSFPAEYPFNAAPIFEFSRRSNVKESIRERLLQVLLSVSQQQVRRNRSCLEPCLRQLVNTLENSMPEDPESSSQAFTSTTHYDASIPFPRTSGARFCGADCLVVFTRPTHLQRINAPTDATPRSLSALAAYLNSHVIPMKPRGASSSPSQTYPLTYQPVAHSPSGDSALLSHPLDVKIASFYKQDMKQKSRRSHSEGRSSKPQSTCGAVLIYSTEKLMPINRILAQNYILSSSDVHAMCMKNASVAAMEGCKDLVQVWSLASLIVEMVNSPNKDPENGTPWAFHPYGRNLLQSLISYYINKHDVQTAAMLTCMFHNKPPEKVLIRKVVDMSSSSSSGSPGGSPYHTVVPADHASESWILGHALKRNRSNSWSDFIEEFKFPEGTFEYRDSEKEVSNSYSKLLDPKLYLQYDQFKKAYADILHRWNLLEQRAQVLKYSSVGDQSEKTRGFDFVADCQHCHSDVTGPYCAAKCKKFSFNCVICHVAVKGLSSFCLACGHGGHTTHLEEWFYEMDVCPSGCGCRCLEANNIFDN